MLQSSTIPLSQDLPIAIAQDSVNPSLQGSTLRSSPEPTVPTFEESTTQISQMTELIQSINRHVNDDNTAIIQASLDNILLQTINLILHKQVYQQGLTNKSAEIAKRDDTIVTLTGNIDSNIAIIGNLQIEVKKKNDGLLKKSNAITMLNKSNALKEHKVKELEALLASRDAALQQRLDDLATAEASCSEKDETIKQLEAQVKARDKKITTLEYKLSCDIAKGLRSGRPQTGKPIDRNQACGLRANASRQPKNEASVDGSDIARNGRAPQHLRT
jgi:hypothetical protein